MGSIQDERDEDERLDFAQRVRTNEATEFNVGATVFIVEVAGLSTVGLALGFLTEWGPRKISEFG